MAENASRRFPRISSSRTTVLSEWATLVENRVIASAGDAGVIYHSVATPDYVSILAMTPDGRIPLVRQFRPALDRFTLERDESAFAELVRRHGPMVLAACRRVLRHEQDAEDAFQAAFLVLARKASSIRQHDCVGGWLYQVAHRLAVRAKTLGTLYATPLAYAYFEDEPGTRRGSAHRRQVAKLPELLRL